MSRTSATLSSASQHAMPPEFGRKRGTECLNTRFPLLTLQCAGYSVMLNIFFIITVLPLQALSLSRRTAYLSFIITAYVAHCFYTSNLLSHLVHDKNVPMDLKALAESDYKVALLKDMNIITDRKVWYKKYVFYY